MSLLVCPDARTAATRLADLIEETIKTKPRAVLGLATGFTPARAYRELVMRHNRDLSLSFRHLSTFNTDEFIGLHPEDPRSARYFMNRHLFSQVDICRENTHVPRGDVVDIDAECRAYEDLLRARGGLDLVVLGLGHNGHVGFNEPGSGVRTRTRRVEFTASTLAGLSDGNRFESLDQTPIGALTIGIGTILEARRVLLIATGLGKAQAVARTFTRRPGPTVPASQLMRHGNVTMVVDQDAAGSVKVDGIEVEHVG